MKFEAICSDVCPKKHLLIQEKNKSIHVVEKKHTFKKFFFQEMRDQKDEIERCLRDPLGINHHLLSTDLFRTYILVTCFPVKKRTGPVRFNVPYRRTFLEQSSICIHFESFKKQRAS